MLVLFISVALFAGCSSRPTEGGGPEEHTEEGPHGGPLAELGAEEYHAELVQEADEKKATVYILDKAGEKAVAIDEKTEVTLAFQKDDKPVTVKLEAEKQDGDPEGQVTAFSKVDDNFSDDLDPDEVEVRLEIKGKPYKGKFSHKH